MIRRFIAAYDVDMTEAAEPAQRLSQLQRLLHPRR